MKNKLQKFKYRKAALAIADALIIAVSAIIANYTLMALHDGIVKTPEEYNKKYMAASSEEKKDEKVPISV